MAPVRVVATGGKLLAGAISQQALRTLRGAPASSRQRLGDVVATYLRRQPVGFRKESNPKSGCLNRVDNRGLLLRTRP